MPTPKPDETQDEWLGRCIPILVDEGNEQDQAVAICYQMWRDKDKKALVIKSETEENAVVAGYGVIFGGKDLDGETFTNETEFMLDMVPVKDVYYDHTVSRIGHAVGKSLRETVDEFGIWVETEIDKQKEYARYVLDRIRKGELGYSSGSVGHLVRKLEGLIKRWPIVEWSLTPTPAEPRTLGIEQVKSVFSVAGIEMPRAFVKVGDEDSGDEQIQAGSIRIWKRKKLASKKSKILSLKR